ncbi:hypothetical protein ACPCHQ_17060 [Ralstonia thomasii]|jgi:hypothetical protein|uniref:Bacteriophage P22, Gp10, DNA-stabilising n=2 Tax=Ralstonia TaxID=48736 RepID=A0ABN9JC01_9RALS|nr:MULTISPECIES: hypothetical protein [Ralstonia]MBT2181014.1 hypothetical protein [Ralstonia pickettii]CAJ0710706.1 hypothetical protein LMG7143_01696 [Ralstonia sp. LMG 18095]CAJ0806249.1 hypothetical protein LMG18095_04409 [Ralstonia sp. LMG 18095]
MTRLTLEGGFYLARSLIADAQRCVNLIPERNSRESEVSTTHYPTPGKTLLATVGTGPIRGAYAATNGILYVASGSSLYMVSSSWITTAVSALTTSSGPVSMKDNGTSMIVADGSQTGVRVKLATNIATFITSTSDANWRGADRVDYADGYFVCNVPGARQWFISDVQADTFSNPLYFASKEGNADLLQVAPVVHREIWLIGTDTTEVYFNTGDVSFPYQRMPGVFIQHGCAAKGSVATWDLSLFWLGRDPQGQFVVFRGGSYQAQRISTHAIEEQISGYGTVSDAIGYCYQQEGHPFYVLTFPTADATWVFDIGNGLWHERASMDGAGMLHRDISNCQAVAYGVNVVGDYQNGNLYKLDQSTFTDNGNAVPRIRSFPTLDIEDKRVIYEKLTLDFQTGIGQATGTWQNPMVDVRWSDDGGYTWGNKVQVPVGAIGRFSTRATLWRMGMGRRRVYEVSWAWPMDTALNGAWLDIRVGKS